MDAHYRWVERMAGSRSRFAYGLNVACASTNRNYSNATGRDQYLTACHPMSGTAGMDR
jgi:hypothetical protein